MTVGKTLLNNKIPRTPVTSTEKRADIEFLRGLAISLVLLYHLRVPFFENGYVGVDIFLVISGFLMARVYDGRSAADFYTRRLNRLFPLYIIAISLTLAYSISVAAASDFSQVSSQVVAALFFSSNILYWSQNSYFEYAAFNPLLHLWSLGLEVQFYLLFPLIFSILRSRKLCFIGIFMVSLLGCMYVQSVSPKTAFFLLPFRLWEFLVGVGIGWWGTATAESRVRPLAFWALLTVLLMTVLFFESKPNHPGSFLYGHPASLAVITTFVTGLLIRLHYDASFSRSKFCMPLVWMGHYSYSIYLFHFPLIVLYNYSPFEGNNLVFTEIFTPSFLLIFSVVFAVFIQKLVEVRFRYVYLGVRLKMSVVSLLLVLSFVLPWVQLFFHTPAQRNIIASVEDRGEYRCGKVYRIFNPSGVICNLTPAAKGGSVLLLGDSYADSLKSAFSEVAFEYDFSTHFAVSNDPLVKKNLGADFYFHQAEKIGVNAIILHFSNRFSSSEFSEEVLKLTKLAIDYKIKIYIIAPVPTYTIHIPKVLLESGDEFHFKTDRKTHQSNVREFGKLSEILKEHGARVYDPAGVLCVSGGVCAVASSEMNPYYYDSGHLTLTGAATLKPLFRDIMNNLTAR